MFLIWKHGLPILVLCLMFTIVVGVLSAMASCSAPVSCWLSHIMKVVFILPAIFWRQQIG